VRQLAPDSGLNPGHAERAEAHTAQALDRDADFIHHPAYQVIDPLTNDDFDDEPFSRFAGDANLFRDDPLALDRDPVTKALEGGVGRSHQSEDVILLVEAVARMHDAIRDVAIVGQEQQALGVAVEPADGIDPLGNRHQIHYRAAVALILGGGDVAARFVEQDVAWPLRLEQLAVDANSRASRIGLGAELGHDGAVDADAAGANQLFGGTARTDASRGEDSLQPFHGRGVAPAMRFETE
jgi:hypothetical protein